MKTRLSNPALERPDPGPIRAGEVYTLRQAARRLNWARKSVADAQKAGLRTVLFGRQKFVTGAEVLRFFKALESQQGNGKSE
jgi:hypothetical protein